MIKAILVDDEKIALNELKHILGEYEEISVEGAFTDPIEALQKIKYIKPDVVFLDIEMPEVNGFIAAEEIMSVDEDIIIVFVTAYDEYAIKAFETNAAGYILKPISKESLGRTMEKVKKYCTNKEQMKKINISELNKNIKPRIDKIFVWQNNEILLISPSTVLYFKAEGGDVALVTEQKEYSTKYTLNYWEERMSQMGFLRCHKSFLINIDRIEKIIPLINNTFAVKLANHSYEIPVSRNYIRLLKEALGM